jgi:hypothetical protein
MVLRTTTPSPESLPALRGSGLALGEVSQSPLLPVLLLPDNILDCLTAREMESIVAHDLCHIRVRDNLATVIHTAVEVVFWFHPLA